MKKDSKNEKELIKKSLSYSILDGSFDSVKVGIGESFLSPFAIFLKATDAHLGLLSSLPRFLGSLSQLFSIKLIDKFKSRKKIVITGAFIQSLIWIPILLCFYLQQLKVEMLIFFVIMYFVSGMIVSPAWNVWMGDLVEEEHRGKYFGRRTKIAGIVAFFSLLLGGLILNAFKDGAETQFIGFLILFLMAMVAKIISVVFLSKKYEPKIQYVEDKDKFSLLKFMKDKKYSNFKLFTAYMVSMNFALYIAAPYFIAYMFNSLKFNYITYTAIVAIDALVRYSLMPAWGKFADKYGTKKTMVLSGLLMPAVPLLWIVSPRIEWIILLHIFSGFVWSGFEISTFNYLYDSTKPEIRARCVSYHNVLNGIAIFAGAMVGALLLKYNFLFWTSYLFVFLVSGILRYLSSLIFLGKLQEVRKVRGIGYERLLIKLLTVEIYGVVNEIVHFDYNLKKRLKKVKRGVLRLSTSLIKAVVLLEK